MRTRNACHDESRWTIANSIDQWHSEGGVEIASLPIRIHAERRRLAKKKKFSKRWRKAKAVITKLDTKVANVRKHFVHTASHDISKNHVVVVIEDLQVKNMSQSATKKVAQKSGLNRSILDASPFELRRQLEYKTQWRGGLLVAVAP
jgi:putative transposase